MIGVILCTHSDFAKGLRNAVEMIAGEQSCFDSFCFMNGDDVDELSEKIAAAAQRYIDQKMPFCILVDMFAATPFNASLKYTAEHGGYVLTGANLPLLLEILTSREYYDGDDIKAFLSNALDSVKESMQVIDAKAMAEEA